MRKLAILAVLLASTGTASADQLNGTATIPPLDSPYVWANTDQGKGGGTHETLSLIYEQRNPFGYVWPLYVQTTETPDPFATQQSTQDTGIQSRFTAPGTGAGWGSAIHGEVYAYNRGVTIVDNAEASKYGNGLVIGYEANANVGNPDKAVDIQGNWKTGIDLHGHSIIESPDLDSLRARVGTLEATVAALSQQIKRLQHRRKCWLC